MSSEANPSGPGEERAVSDRRLPPAWTSSLWATITYLKVELQLCRGNSEDQSIVNEIRGDIEQVERLLRDYENCGWWGRLTRRARLYEYSDALLSEALGSILLVVSDAAVLARVPAMRADMKRYISVSDPRQDTYTRILDTFDSELRKPNVSGTAAV